MRDPIVQLLDDAAAAGRTSDPSPADELARAGHLPVPPTLRCQQCGRRLELQATGGRWWWAHEPSPTDHPDTPPIDPAFGAAVR